jgi:hypothetical protein
MVSKSGFQTPIVWDGQQIINGLPPRIRIRVTFAGKRKSDIRFAALYSR